MDVIEGLCRNISIGGMFIAFDDSRPAGSLVRFELELEDQSAIRGLGEVVWMKAKNEFGGPESGFGLKFRFLEQRDRQLIFKLVSQHIKERLSKREPEGGGAQPPAPTPEALGIAVPPAPPPASAAPPAPALAVPAATAPEPSPVAPEPESEPAFELPPFEPPAEPSFEPPAPEPEPAFEPPADSEPVFDPAAPAPQGPAVPSFSVSEPVLPDLEEFSTADLEAPDGASRPMEPADFDSIDLDPTVGETPMYELGLGPGPSSGGAGTFDPVGSEEFPAAAEPAGLADGEVESDAGLREHVAREVAVAKSVPWPRRHFSLLLVVAVVLATIAGAAYLYKDQVMARFGGEAVADLGDPAADTFPEAGDPGAASPSAEAPSPGVEAADPQSSSDSESGTDPAQGPPPAAPPPAVTPPPPAVAPPPPAVAPPPPATPPPVAPASGADFTRLVDVTWSEVSGGIKIILTGDGPIPTGRYRYFSLSGGSPREVVKLIGVDQGFSKGQLTVGGPGVQRIRFGFHQGSEIHVVLDLAGPGWTITEVANVGSRLELTLSAP